MTNTNTTIDKLKVIKQQDPDFLIEALLSYMSDEDVQQFYRLYFGYLEPQPGETIH